MPAELWISHICDSNGKIYDINMRDSLGSIYFEDYPERKPGSCLIITGIGSPIRQ